MSHFIISNVFSTISFFLLLFATVTGNIFLPLTHHHCYVGPLQSDLTGPTFTPIYKTINFATVTGTIFLPLTHHHCCVGPLQSDHTGPTFTPIYKTINFFGGPQLPFSFLNDSLSLLPPLWYSWGTPTAVWWWQRGLFTTHLAASAPLTALQYSQY